MYHDLLDREPPSNWVAVTGIDPGIVDTGIVRVSFDPDLKSWSVRPNAIRNATPQKITDWVNDCFPAPKDYIFVEKYQPRSHFSTDRQMVQLQEQLRMALPKAKFISNTGIKRVVNEHLMETLRMWRFSTVTHHQDMRSAARIALYGMMKDPELNKLLADFTAAYLKRDAWTYVG